MQGSGPGNKAERDQVRREMLGRGASLEEIAEEMTRRWGYRPRAAWRLAHDWTQDEAAQHFNQAVGRAEASMTGKRISDYENWPLNGSKIRPTPTTLRVLAAIYQTTPNQLIDHYDHGKLTKKERLALETPGVPSNANSNSRQGSNTQEISAALNSNGVSRSFDSKLSTASLSRNLPWERLSSGNFEDLVFRLLGTVGFVDREWHRTVGHRAVVAKKVSPDLPGRMRVERWVVECDHGGQISEVQSAQAIVAQAEELLDFDVLLIITTGYLPAATKEWLSDASKDRPFRVQWIERDSDFHEDGVKAIFQRARSIFEENGLDLDNATSRVQDSFPEPYRDHTGWAMSYDVSDRRKYGLDTGVVLRREHLRPLYTRALIAHELTHTALGQIDTEYLAFGLEEGLAEVFGTVFVGGKLVDTKVSEAIVINSRLKYPQPSQRWQTYVESIRQASLVVLRDGWDGAVDLLRRGNRLGRGEIKKAESELLRSRQLTSANHATSRGRMTEFAETFLSFPASLVVSPMSLLLAERLHNEMKVSELLDNYGAAQEPGDQALAELQRRVYLVVVHKGRISADETKQFLETNTLRYEVPLSQA